MRTENEQILEDIKYLASQTARTFRIRNARQINPDDFLQQELLEECVNEAIEQFLRHIISLGVSKLYNDKEGKFTLQAYLSILDEALGSL